MRTRMEQRERLRVALVAARAVLLALSLVLLTMSPTKAAPTKAPNFLFLQTDSMDGRVLDPTSPIWNIQEMPNLRRVAANGVNFANTYSPSPQCVPSRTAMWSSKRVDQIQTWNNDQGFCAEWDGWQCVNQNVSGLVTLMMDPFLEAGYDVSLKGKMDIGGGYNGGFHGNVSGLDAWTRASNITKPTQGGPTVTLDQSSWTKFSGTMWECADLLQNASSDKPFFMYCSIDLPHPKYFTNATFAAMVNDSAIPTPTWLDWDEMHPYDKYMTVSKCLLPKDCAGLSTNSSDPEVALIRKTWFAMVAEADALMGITLDALEEYGFMDNTYIIYTSDHGELNMEHRQWLKNAMYEGSTRVPLLLSGPNIPSGKVVKNFTTLLDIFPTLMDLAGLPYPSTGLEGHSLLPLIYDTPSDRPDYIVSQYHSNFGNTGSFMIRQGPWKYIAFGELLGVAYPPQLFNLDIDPDELDDVSLQNPAVVAQLDALLRTVIDYPAVDLFVKTQDKEKYLSWAAYDGDPIRNFFIPGYVGFDADDVLKVEQWLAFTPPFFDQRPSYHFLPPSDWMNDPNGLMYYNGVYHMFYQYNPESALSANKHWGHAVSSDMVYWTYLPVALAPSESYDINGIWSGSSTIVGNTPIALYTGISNTNTQEQCSAFPADLSDKYLIQWNKTATNPIITAPTSLGSLEGFRDPTTAWVNSATGYWNILVGSGFNNTGTALVFSSQDFAEWTFENPITTSPVFPGNMWECPDFYTLQNGSETVNVLKGSAGGQDWWSTGSYDAQSNQFASQLTGLFDYGEFYASKSFADGSGRRIVFGWVAETDSEASQVARGWAGVQSLPRVITLNEDLSLSITPLPELAALRNQSFTYTDINLSDEIIRLGSGAGAQLEIQITFDSVTAEQFGINVLSSLTTNETTAIYLSGNTINVDRTNSTLATDAENFPLTAPVSSGTLSFTVFVDHSIIEVFTDGGNIVARVYPTSPDSTGIEVFATGGSAVVSKLSVWTLNSIWE